MNSELDEASDRLDELTQASQQNIDNVLKQYYFCIRLESKIGKTLSRMLPPTDFEEWHQTALNTRGGMVGSAKMEWPIATEERVSLQYQLVQALASDSINLGDFAYNFTYEGSNVNDNNQAFVSRVIVPFHNDLLRLMQRSEQESEENNIVLPAITARGDLDNSPSVDTLISNQAFLQSLNSLVQSITKTRGLIEANNLFSVEHENDKAEISKYLNETEVRITSIIEQVDLNENPEPIQNNATIVEWVRNEWPESIEKLNEYTSKKAMADMLVPTGVVATFGVVAVLVGVLFGIAPSYSFGAGSFIGMFATRQVSSKDATRKIQSSLKEDDPKSGLD